MPESAPERRKRACMAEAMSAQRTALAEIDWRLLQWLLRYPLQRADDLVVGVSRWASRATVYRHVQELVEHGLVESILPKTPGAGKWLYYLSNFGLHALAVYLDRPAGDLAQRWHADEQGILHVLPRLSTLLQLQDIVNGLVTQAAEAMTTQGRRPQLVRWTWQRDLVHRFQYRDRSMRFFADGAVALCLRPQQSGGRTGDKWYGLFLLCTELDDERLMRLRLERLLRWRESPERWQVYQHMPPVLILARSMRQCEHWQLAAEAVVLKLRLDPLAGAVASLPSSESTRMNPWLLPWRTLASDASCRLQQLLKPLPCAAFPPPLGLETGKDEEKEYEARASSTTSTATHSVSSARSARPRRLIRGNLARRALHLTQDGRGEQEVIALLGLRLTARHWSMMRLLLAHPLLCDEDLVGLLALERKSVCSALYELRALGCLEPISTPAGRRWHLSERGLRLVAAANHVHLRNFAVAFVDEAEDETLHMEQRGEAWLLSHIEHTAGVYGFFATLAQAARQQPAQELCWWETGAMCERRYQIGEHWHNLRPDAFAAYCVGSKQVHFWLEWDRGTMNARDLAIKFASYTHYIDSREWAREWAALPWLVCVTPEITQERRVQRIAQAKLPRISGLVVWTTTEAMLREHGPLAPIWSFGMLSSDRIASPSGSRRRLLFHMHTEMEVT